MRPSWSVGDFILVWLGGFLGAGVLFALGLLFESDDVVFVMSLAGQYVGNLGVLWLLKRRKQEDSLGFSIQGTDTFYLGLGLVFQVAVLLLFLPLTLWLFPDGAPRQEVAEMLGDVESSALLRIALVLAALVLAPVTEELVFRGVLLRSLERQSKRLIIVTTATVFAAVHVLGLDTDRLLASAAVVLPPIFILGLVLAWITLRTGRLGPAIFLHSGWNLLAAFVLLLPPEFLESAS